jgi:hypothetical protein
MVAGEPDGGDIFEATIFSDIFGAKVAVVIYNSLRLRYFVVERLSGGPSEEEIIVEECHRIKLL